MAVHSNTFGGVQLSGQDADKFREQSKSRPNKAAKRAAANGLVAARRLMSQWQVKDTDAA